MIGKFDRITLLETFVRIAERKSLTAAARDLGVSQPSVSRQLIALEKHLGVALARRTTHDLTLTPDGVLLLGDARRILSEWESIENHYTQDKTLKGVIRVVAPFALGQSFLVDAASNFMNEHPDVSIEWKLQDEDIRFAEEGCDCWIKVGGVKDETLVVREITKVDRLVVGTPKCMLDHEEIALPDVPWLALTPFEGKSIELFDSENQTQTFSVKPRMTSHNIFAIWQAVLNNVGIAIMPRWFVKDALEKGEVIDVLPDLRAGSLPVNLVIAAGTKRPVRVEKFCETIENWCRQNLQPEHT